MRLSIKQWFEEQGTGDQVQKKLADVLVILTCLLLLTTLVQAYIAVINRVIAAVLFVILSALFVLRVKRLKSYLVLGLVAILEICALVSTDFPMHNLNDVVYFPFVMLYLEYFASDCEFFKEALQRNVRTMKIAAFIWTAVVSISLLFPGSYSAAWGEGSYFYSITQSIFRLAPTAVFIIAIVLYLITAGESKWYALLCVLPMYCFFEGGSRIYLGIGILIMLILWYKLIDNKRIFLLSLIPIAIVGIIVFVNSSIMDKFTAILDLKFDILGKLTSGRSVFWKYDVDAFLSETFGKQLVGMGFNYIYDVNKEYFNVAIWAHNDFIQIVTTYGWLGLASYLFVIFDVFLLVFKRSKEAKWVLAVTVCIWLFNAFFNMFYTYICAALSYVVILCALLRNSEQKE